MAAISGLPNFFNATGPVQSDFNNAAKAICTQIGGTFYDETAASYSSAIGNLDSGNIVAAPLFRNSQKAEPFDYLAMSGWSLTTAGTGVDVNTFFPNTIILGMVARPCVALYLSLMAGRTATTGIAGGAVTLYVNNASVLSIGMNQSATTDSTKEISFTQLSPLALSAGDYIYVDFTNLNPFGVGPWTTAAGTVLQACLFCKSLQVG